MDPGWAVVLGALIALAGSSFVPWIREAATSSREAKAARASRLRAAVIDLLSANAAQGAARILDSNQDLQTAFEAYTRAAARLLIEVEPSERRALSLAINAAAAGSRDTGERVRAFQYALTSWAGGDIAAAALESTYREEFDRLKRKPGH